MVRFGERHPVTTLLYFISVTGIVMFIPSPAIRILSLAGGLLYLFLSETAKPRHLTALFILSVAITLINPLISHKGETVLFYINDLAFTLEALLYGANAALLTASVLIWTYSFSRIMTVERVLCVTGKLSPGISVVISSAVRSIPLFSGYYSKISSIKMLNRSFDEEKTLPGELKKSLNDFSATCGLAIEGSIDEADSMDARGFGSEKRKSYSRFVFGRRDVFITVSILILTAVISVFAATGTLDFEFYPVISHAEYGPGFIAAITIYAIAAFYPTVSEAAWMILWKRRGAGSYPGAAGIRKLNLNRKEKQK